LIVARYLGAVPVVGDEPAYRGLSEDAGVVVVSGGALAWEAALTGLRHPDRRAALRARLAAFCAERFTAERLQPAFERLCALAPEGARASPGSTPTPRGRGLALVRRAARVVREAR